MEPKQDDIRKTVIDAFCHVIAPSEVSREWIQTADRLALGFVTDLTDAGQILDIEQARAFYSDLCLYTPGVFIFVLPRLLVRAIDRYPQEAIDLDYIVRGVNICSNLTIGQQTAVIGGAGETLGHVLIEKQSELAEYKLGQFISFTRKQIFALIEWLHLAATWSDFAELYHDDITSALEGWQFVLEEFEERLHIVL